MARTALERLDLGRLFAQLNRSRFGSRLPEYRVEWSRRLRLAGVTYQGLRIIRLSVRYLSYFPEDVMGILLHEMCHIRHRDHGPGFLAEAERVGARRYCRAYPEYHRPYRYVYECPRCGDRYRTRKRVRASCGGCSGARYQARFRLRLAPAGATAPAGRLGRREAPDAGHEAPGPGPGPTTPERRGHERATHPGH